jgi:hypothetical protein
MWAFASSTKEVDIVIVDPAQFKAERAKVDSDIESAARNKRSVGDINRASGREAGKGVFEQEILECPRSSAVKRIVVSTDATTGGLSVGVLSEQLFFYVIGYDQGFTQGLANSVP